MTTSLESPHWQPLLEAFREEIKEYGGLYQILAEQQEAILQRDADTVLRLNQDVETQTALIEKAHRLRESLWGRLAKGLGVAPGATIVELGNALSEPARILLRALADEINQMVRRTAQKARQNHLLLSRTMEVIQEALRLMEPERMHRTYERNGRFHVQGQPAVRYEAIG